MSKKMFLTVLSAMTACFVVSAADMMDLVPQGELTVCVTDRALPYLLNLDIRKTDPLFRQIFLLFLNDGMSEKSQNGTKLIYSAPALMDSEDGFLFVKTGIPEQNLQQIASNIKLPGFRHTSVKFQSRTYQLFSQEYQRKGKIRRKEFASTYLEKDLALVAKKSELLKYWDLKKGLSTSVRNDLTVPGAIACGVILPDEKWRATNFLLLRFSSGHLTLFPDGADGLRFRGVFVNPGAQDAQQTLMSLRNYVIMSAMFIGSADQALLQKWQEAFRFRQEGNTVIMEAHLKQDLLNGLQRVAKEQIPQYLNRRKQQKKHQ